MTDDIRREFSALVSRLATVTRAERPPLLSRFVSYLAQPVISPSERIAAAARALKVVHDRDRPVRRIARALVAGLSRNRALERLRLLQHQVERCDALDKVIEEREKRVRLKCPRCHIRLPRIEMVNHLWHEHELILERGKARSPVRILEELQEQHATTGASAPLDKVAALGGTVRLRRWLAGDDLSADDLSALLKEACDHGAGLCPTCFAVLPAAVEALPQPLQFGRGRLAGDGFAIELGGNAWFRTLRATTVGGESRGRRSLAPRAVGTLGALAILSVTLALARTPAGAMIGIGVAIIAYSVARALRSTTRSRADRAIDAAWFRFAARLAERPHSTRFLTRLCLASSDRGNPESRAWILNAMNRRASRRANDSDEELQLLAAVRVLQVEDMSRFGRDVTAGIAALAADGFTGALPADYADFVIGSYLACPREPGQLGRLRVLLLEAAFDAGLAPSDLVHLCAGAPNLRRAMMVEPTHRLGLLFGLWRNRESKTWESIAPALTVFALARTSPPTAARILAHCPDVLLYHSPSPEVEEMVGPILVCARGVSIGGVFVADPEADLRLANDGRRFIFGRFQFDVPRRLPRELPAVLASWLRYRADVLMPFIEESLAAGSESVVRRVLGPYCRKCLECGTVSAVSAGAVGQPVQS